jgi:hypothetical protein
MMRLFLFIVGFHVVGANVHKVGANLEHFALISEVFLLNDGPVLGDALPKHLDQLDLIFENDEYTSVATIFRVSSKGYDSLFEVHVLNPLVLDEVVDAHEGAVGDQEGAAAERHRIE